MGELTFETGLVASLTCMMVGAVGASLAAWRKRVTPSVLLYVVCLAGFVSATIPYITLAVASTRPWWFSIPFAAFFGLMVFGVTAWLERNETKIPDEVEKLVRRRLGMKDEEKKE